MNKYLLINWSHYTQYSKADKQYVKHKLQSPQGIYDSELEAMVNATHSTPSNAEAQGYESYTELIEFDQDFRIIDTTYFI